MRVGEPGLGAVGQVSDQRRRFGVLPFNGDDQLASDQRDGRRCVDIHRWILPAGRPWDDRGLVLCRVGDQYAMDMHIDMDEANAAMIKTGDPGLVKKQTA